MTGPGKETARRNGTLCITIHAALRRPHKDDLAHDLVFEIKQRDGLWDRECIAEARTFNAPLHEFSVQRTPDGMTWTFDGNIAPDPWASGGPLKATVTFNDTAGEYRGSFAGSSISGKASSSFVDKPRPSLGVSSTPTAILSQSISAGTTPRLYDYSLAGYRYGEDPRPIGALPVFHVRDFGAQANSGAEAVDGIQAAIDAASAAGGGIVQLDAGVYDIRIDKWREPLKITTSHVILRGAGSHLDGTLIVNHRYTDSPEPRKTWLAAKWPMVRADGAGTEGATPVCRIVEAKRGDFSVVVDKSSDVRVGDTYVINHIEDESGSLAKALLDDACIPAANYRAPGTPLVSQLVTVKSIDGARIAVDLPLTWSLSGPWKSVLVPARMLRGVGVEHIRFRTHWDGHFVHHKNPEHDNGWDHVNCTWLQDSWIRDVVSENATSSIGLANIKNCTIMDCRITGNPGHNGYCLGGSSTANLLLRLDCERPMHAFNLSGQISGNVILDCRISEPGGVDLHGGTGLDNLIDRLTGGVLVGGGSESAVPPRHGPGLTMWNWARGHYHPYAPWRRVDRVASWRETPGFVAVGVHSIDGHQCTFECRRGTLNLDNMSQEAWVESLNQAVMPSSLYRAQIKARMGSIPSYLNAT